MSEMTEKDYADSSDAAKIGAALFKYFNDMDSKNGWLIDAVLSCHRTVQQKIGAWILNMILAWGRNYRSGYYDARNEALCKMCSDLSEFMRQKNMTYMPIGEDGEHATEIVVLPFV